MEWIHPHEDSSQRCYRSWCIKMKIAPTFLLENFYGKDKFGLVLSYDSVCTKSAQRIGWIIFCLLCLIIDHLILRDPKIFGLCVLFSTRLIMVVVSLFRNGWTFIVMDWSKMSSLRVHFFCKKGCRVSSQSQHDNVFAWSLNPQFRTQQVYKE